MSKLLNREALKTVSQKENSSMNQIHWAPPNKFINLKDD